MKKHLLTALLLFIFCVRQIFAGDEIVIGSRIKFDSKILDKEIKISIHVPEDHLNSQEKYITLFIFQSDFVQVSGAVRNIYENQLIPKTIVVSVDNYEYGYLSPTALEGKPGSGQANLFLQFFNDELFPFIDSNYRTQPYRIVFSNSWGGMFCVYSILAKPEIFNAAIASVPWLPYDGNQHFLIKKAPEFLKTNNYNNYLFMAMDNELEILPDLEQFLEILEKTDESGLEWNYNYWPEEDHDSTPYRAIYAGLKKLFKDWNNLPHEIASAGLESLKKYETELNKKFGYEIGLSPFAIRNAGLAFQNAKNYDEAILLFNYLVEKTPSDPISYVTLGRAYNEMNKPDLALVAFQKAYDLALESSHPQIRWIKNFLDNTQLKIKEKSNLN